MKALPTGTANTVERKQRVLDAHPNEGYELGMCLAIRSNEQGFCRRKTALDGRCNAHTPVTTVPLYRRRPIAEDFYTMVEEAHRSPALIGRREDLAAVKATIMKLVSILNDEDEVPTIIKYEKGMATPQARYMTILLDAVDKMGKVIESVEKAEGRRNPALEVSVFAQQAAIIVAEHLKECPHCGATLHSIAQEIKRVIAEGRILPEQETTGEYIRLPLQGSGHWSENIIEDGGTEGDSEGEGSIPLVEPTQPVCTGEGDGGGGGEVRGEELGEGPASEPAL